VPNPISALILVIISYGIGSIPFGLLLTRLAGGPDLRTIGSGNIGATNVLRTGRKDLAAATLLLDALKGAVVVGLARHWFGEGLALVAAVAAICGHLYPVWLGFRGGKGVATYLGCLAATFLPAAAGFAAVWLAVAYLSRYSSLAALVASLVSPLILWGAGLGTSALVFGLLSLALWFKHRANISRLIAGSETQIGSKPKA
jgi:glycerol-3-phosphate acyltransferase PlsY